MITKRARVSLTWMSAVALGLLAGPASAVAEQAGGRQCSVRTLDGSYGTYRTGKGAFGGPLVGQGFVTFDGEGNWTALVTNVRDGEVSLDEEFAGTYTIDADCRGSLFIDDVENERIVVVDDAKGFYLVGVGGSNTIYAVGTKIHSGKSGDRDR
jgi:hypothetical protein